MTVQRSNEKIKNISKSFLNLIPVKIINQLPFLKKCSILGNRQSVRGRRTVDLTFHG